MANLFNDTNALLEAYEKRRKAQEEYEKLSQEQKEEYLLRWFKDSISSKESTK